ncbi:MAG: helix-turn-helix domain-containing protein, partial [Desulfosarcinaceae bacterium]
VRQLENIIASAVLVETKEELSLSSAKVLMSDQLTTNGYPDQFQTLAEMERAHIERALRATAGNRTKAARLLGIGLRTLQRKVKTYAGRFNAPK